MFLMQRERFHSSQLTYPVLRVLEEIEVNFSMKSNQPYAFEDE
jgi:hypothetical protein